MQLESTQNNFPFFGSAPVAASSAAGWPQPISCLLDEGSRERTAIMSAVRRHLHETDVRLLQADAARSYRLRLHTTEREDFARSEHLSRVQIQESWQDGVEGILEWGKALLNVYVSGPKRATKALEERLRRRDDLKAYRQLQVEERLKEEGREAHRLEVEELARKAKEDEENAAREKVRRRLLGAAMTFIVMEERKARVDIEGEIIKGWQGFFQQEEVDRAEAERIAYENFMNTPEQLALTAERERKAEIERKKELRRKKRFQKEQENFVQNCKHGRMNTSVFLGPKARKLCVQCKVRFDDELGYYVRIGESQTRSTSKSSTASKSKTLDRKEKSKGSKISSLPDVFKSTPSQETNRKSVSCTVSQQQNSNIAIPALFQSPNGETSIAFSSIIKR